MIKRVRISMRSFGFATILCGILGLSASAQVGQNFDTSGNGMLKGAYNVRQVLVGNLDQNTSAIGRAVSIIGTMTFDGNGNYSFTGQSMDTQGSGGNPQSFSTSGVYLVAANGLLQIQNPIDNYLAPGSSNPDFDFGAVGAAGPSAIVASSTEGPYDDIFVAIPASSNVSNSSLQGNYQTGFIDFLQGNASQVRDGYYLLNANGSGSFGNVSVKGAMANQGSNNISQSYSGVTYAASNNGFTVSFPTSSTPLTQLISGQKALYVSADGNIVVGGAVNGFDIIVGIKASSGITNSSFNGTYFTAALENDASDLSNGNNNIDSFYGSTHALGQGTTVDHLRLVTFDAPAYDYTADGVPYNFASDGTFNTGVFEDLLGINGQALLQVGTGTTYSLSVGLQSKQYSATGVFIDPNSILNGASFAPITNSVAPGEYVSIFGSGLSSSTLAAQSLPLQTNLGGVQVTVNGRAAPIAYVSPNQINLIVPTATSEPYAFFQVNNNGTLSNQVMVYGNATSPGVFASAANGAAGVGGAAVLHADYSLVTQSNPAKAGETLQLYVTGLGAVTPTVSDGAAATSSPLSTVTEDVAVFIDDSQGNQGKGNVVFKGLAPGFASLYQINFTVPSGLSSGIAYLDVSTPEAYTSEAKIYLH